LSHPLPRSGNPDPSSPRFVAGKSGNPGGLSKEHREFRRVLQEQLRAKLIDKDGMNKLASALVFGVENGDPTCIKLCCEYILGKPEQHVTLGADGGEQLGIRVEFVKPGEGK
jgi:hypothetical protein